MKKIHILDFNKYNKFMCEQLHYLLEMGLDNNYKFVEVEMVEYALKLLISDLYNMSSEAIEKELEEKKVEIEELENEIKDLKKYYN